LRVSGATRSAGDQIAAKTFHRSQGTDSRGCDGSVGHWSAWKTCSHTAVSVLTTSANLIDACSSISSRDVRRWTAESREFFEAASSTPKASTRAIEPFTLSPLCVFDFAWTAAVFESLEFAANFDVR
jgi:hypothetical protein